MLASRPQYILGNWKMHGNAKQARQLAGAIAHHKNEAKVVLFPPAVLLGEVRHAIDGSDVALGAQDVRPEADGAFTGDISAAMLRDAGCDYVIVGHSERRTGHGESDALVRVKAHAAMQAGLVPIICVGEHLKEREAGVHVATVRAQVERSLPDVRDGGFIIAYEPVWAIGSGKTPSLSDISEMHKAIASALSCATSGTALGVVYGGSVKAANARDILAAPGVDGVLVGGASLKAEEFCAMMGV